MTAAKLHELGIRTVGEVEALDEPVLVAMLGRATGRQLHALAHNPDPRPVQPARRRGSIGAQGALRRSTTSIEEVDAAFVGLVDRVAADSARPGGSAGPWCSACASTTSLGRAGRTRCPTQRRPRRPS